MQRTHGFSGNRLTRALRAGTTALAATAIIVLAMQPTHGGAEDWFDARAEAILDAYIKTNCEAYCLTDRACFDQCFDGRYGEVLGYLDGLSWVLRHEQLDQLAVTFAPDLVSPAYRERERREKEHQERKKERQECVTVVDRDYRERNSACYENRPQTSTTDEWMAANEAQRECMQQARDWQAAGLKRCTALHPLVSD